MYLEYFGLQETPFAVAPNPRFLFMSAQHEEAFAHLLYGLGEGGGFVLLTGEVGTGKTILSRHLLDRLPTDVDVALIFNPRLNAVELISAICDELETGYPEGSQSLKVLVDALNKNLLTRNASGRRTVLIIDEAQNLSLEVLEQIRLLTNLETERAKLLQVILIGQPELRRMLEAAELWQLTQRITARYHLEHLSAEDTRAYILHRLTLSGGQSSLFTHGALCRVHRLSGGIPRVINTLCDRALLGAFTSNRPQVDLGIVRKAAREALPTQTPLHYGRYALVALATALLGGGLATSAYLVSQNSEWKSAGNRQHAPEPALAAAPARQAKVDRSRSERKPQLKNSITVRHPLHAVHLPFAEVLSDSRLSLQEAFRTLFALWGQSGADASPNCEGARKLGLHCLLENGTWDKMRRFDLPVVLEFVRENGARRYASLVKVDEETATLSIAGENQRFLLAQVLQFWQGNYALLWRPPDAAQTTLRPGFRGKGVQWLREQLGAAGSEDPSYFDQDLKARVLRFQRERGLKSDGIVGPRTIIHLLTEHPAADTPRLVSKE
ncbi:MAG: AAA family ATPase [Gammaproteobacteria bacterium]